MGKLRRAICAIGKCGGKKQKQKRKIKIEIQTQSLDKA